MLLGLSTSISDSCHMSSAAGSPLSVFDYLGDRDGFAIDFVTRRMRINDANAPVNSFEGDPEAKLVNWGSDGFSYDPVRGLEISAARDFSIALSTAAFPYNPSACTVYVKYRLNTTLSSEQRYLMMSKNSGVDRFAMYTVADQSFRFVTGDGLAADISTTSLSHQPDTEYTAVFGIDAFGKTYIDDAGVQEDSGEVLNAFTPSHLGIGGYPDRVLRVLDGYIREIMVVCEPVPRAERLTLSPPVQGGETSPVARPYVFDVLGDRDGFAIDFVSRRMKVNDLQTPGNVFEGEPETKLHNFGSDPFDYDPIKGLNISAGRDFSVGLATALIPFNTNACTVYAKYSLNSAVTAEQRYVFMTDNAGDGRFALYSVDGAPFRFATGDGTSPNIVVSDMTPAADTEYRVVFGSDTNGKTYIDDNGVHADNSETLATTFPLYVGIGGYNDRVLRVLDGYLAEIAVIYEPMPTETRLTLDPFYTVYKAEGDSHTYNTNVATWGVAPDQFYAHRVAQAMGNRFIAGNYGWSGDSSAEMVHQLPEFFLDGRPDIATIYAGANDGLIDIVGDTAPTTTQVSVDHAYKSRLEPGGFVDVGGQKTRITARASNLITFDPPLAIVPVVGDQLRPDTTANIEYWIDEVRARGVNKIAVIGYHFINFTQGGDAPDAEHPGRAAIRVKQKAAAASRNVPYIDVYAHMATKITSGEVTLGDDLAWHVDVGNTHLNIAGEQAVADAVYDAFVALGWNAQSSD